MAQRALAWTRVSGRLARADSETGTRGLEELVKSIQREWVRDHAAWARSEGTRRRARCRRRLETDPGPDARPAAAAGRCGAAASSS